MISCSLEKYVMLYVYFKNTQLISYGELNFLPESTFILIEAGCTVQLFNGTKNTSLYSKY